MRSLTILGAIAVALVGCSGQSESGAGTASRDEVREVAPAPDFELWANADEHPPYAFGVAGGASADGVRLIILEETETPGGLKRNPVLTSRGEAADFGVSFTDSEGRPLLHPRALLAVRDRSDEGLQRVFIVFEGAPDSAPAHALGEVLVNLSALEASNMAVTTGRVFSLPVRGSLAGVSLSAVPGVSRLTVNVPVPTGDASQPVVLVYDISPDAMMAEPIDILMVPAN